MMFWRTSLEVLTVLTSASWVASHPTKRSTCTAEAIQCPSLFGAEILNVNATEHYDEVVPVGSLANLTVSYCGVDITYTHPGWNDTINVQIWLPLQEWNGRFQGTGGGGWVTGNGPPALAAAVSEGYSAASTDGGHSAESALAASPSVWALLSEGNLNYPLLQDFAHRALADMTILGKAVSESFYGRKPSHSYWVGCSTGGRQGLMMAQRYPELYDGIIALAPAISWDSLLVAGQWVQQVINQIGSQPTQCEMEAFTQAAIAQCDELDGLKDGVISDPSACDISPYDLVGKPLPFTCEGSANQTFTFVGAQVADAAWTGPVDSNGTLQFHGLEKDTSLAYAGAPPPGPVDEAAQVPPFSVDWLKYFIAKDPDFDVNNMTNEEYFTALHQSRNEFNSIIGTSDPDLSRFKARNGKMITWHGLADRLIPPNNTESYYRRVAEVVPDVHDFYRFYKAPGVQHCAGGAGPQPTLELEALVKWVEEGVAPDVLPAVNATLNGVVPSDLQTLPTRKICAWPKQQVYNGGDPNVAESFDCV